MFDPFGFHNSMMRNFMLDPFGQQQQQQQQQRNGGNGSSNSGRNSQQLALRDPFGMMMSSSSSMSPFERHHQMMMRSDPFSMMNSMMGNMGSMFRNMDQLVSTDPNSQVYSSSSVISYSSSGDGRPKIYQESKQIRHGPGGVKETREMVRDTSKGIEKVAIGHHIGDRAHIIERQKLDDGAMEEIVNLENLDEEEVQEFNKEFETKIAPHARSFNSHHGHNNHHHHRSLHLNNNHPLAIEGSKK